jgi:hypothetical protein
VVVLLADAGEDEHLVVHRESEAEGEYEQRDVDDDRAGGADTAGNDAATAVGCGRLIVRVDPSSEWFVFAITFPGEVPGLWLDQGVCVQAALRPLVVGGRTR